MAQHIRPPRNNIMILLLPIYCLNPLSIAVMFFQFHANSAEDILANQVCLTLIYTETSLLCRFRAGGGTIADTPLDDAG